MTNKDINRIALLALTMGDPAGIGLEITLRAWLARGEQNVPVFFIIADPKLLQERSNSFGLSVPIKIISNPADALTSFGNHLPVLAHSVDASIRPGEPERQAVPAILGSIERAVEFVQSGAAGAVVTNPISKAVLYEAGFEFPGHTEYLAALAGSHSKACKPVMMLVSNGFRVVPATMHIALKDVPNSLSQDLIYDVGHITAQGLQRYFTIAEPRLAISGLNPHAGEDGSLGSEEADIISPAIARLKKDGLNVSGPYSADTLFHETARRSYDVAIAMYHDQALIPLKTLGFDNGVNVTLGLPFIRTSPDHGTAFDIADKGQASPQSLIEALRLAQTMRLNAEHSQP